MSYIRLLSVRLDAKLGYDLSMVDLTFGVNYRELITATVDILPQTSLDPDTVITSDQLLPFEIGKVILDIAVTEDGIENIGIIKVLDDAVVTASSLERVFDSDRQLTDTATTIADITFGISSEIYDGTSTIVDTAFSVGKVVTDASTTVDIIEELDVGLSKVDSVVTSEVFNVGFFVDRAFSDSTVVVESPNLAVGLSPILDFASVADTATSLLGKPLTDTLSSSDVVAGIGMTKLLTDTTTIGDIISFEIVSARVFSDTLLVGDTPNLITGKPVDDQTSVSDATLNTLTKSNSDTVITTEDVALEYTAAPPLLGTYMLNDTSLG